MTSERKQGEAFGGPITVRERRQQSKKEGRERESFKMIQIRGKMRDRHLR